jgi:hypothetical protein
LAIRLRFCTVVAKVNWSVAPVSPRSRKRSSFMIRLRWANSISTFFRSQHIETSYSGVLAMCRVALLRRVLAVTGRSDPQDTADRLDPETVTMLIDKCHHDLVWRSSSAWAKYALARRRISLALRSSRFSRSRALMRSRSSVVGSDADRHRFDSGESSHATFALHSRSSGQWPKWPPVRTDSRSGAPEPCARHVHGPQENRS